MTKKEFYTILSIIAITWVIIFFALAKGASAKELHRFYSPQFKGHFYTVSENEKDNLINNDDNWEYEGVAYDVSHDGDYKPVFRHWSENFKGHFYTISESESAGLGDDDNWTYEGIAFYVREQGDPVYRFWSPVYKHHFYTVSESEKDLIINNDKNWGYEGIAWYVADELVGNDFIDSDSTVSNRDETQRDSVTDTGTTRGEQESSIEEQQDNNTTTEQLPVETITEVVYETIYETVTETVVEYVEVEAVEECDTVPMFNYYEDRNDDGYMDTGEFIQRSTGFSTDNVEWQYVGHHNGWTDYNIGQELPTENGHYSVRTSDTEYFDNFLGFPTETRWEKWLEISGSFMIEDGCIKYNYKTDIAVVPAQLPY